MILAGSLILYGTHCMHPTKAVLAYLVVHTLAMIVIAVVIGLSANAVGTESSAHMLLVLSEAYTIIAVIHAIELLVYIYFWIVAYKFYRQLKEGGGGSASATPVNRF